VKRATMAGPLRISLVGVQLWRMSETAQPTHEIKTCETCQKQFLIIPQEQEFYRKKDLPWPTNCPECRQRRRLALRNERKLYKRTCDKCKKDIISTYRPDSPYIIYCQECFWENMG